MLDLKPTPLNVTQEAAQKMPRYLLLALLSIFILSGLFGRDLWSSAETRLLAEVASIHFADPASWLFPYASGEVITEHGPLPGWIGAVFTGLFGGLLGDIRAMRLSSLVWFSISTACIWYGTWFLARRREAQPVEQAFARQAQYRDFGRLMADAATLFFISLFGLVVKQHEALFETAELAFSCAAFFACCRALTRPYWGSALAGFACGAVILCSNLLVGATVLAACLMSHILVRGIGDTGRKIVTTVVAAFAAFSLWPAAAYGLAGEVAGDYFNLWAQHQIAVVGFFDPQEILWFVKHFIWYLCPVWPFAFRAVWVWRRSLSVTHIALPLSFCCAWFVGFLFSSDVAAETLLTATIAPMCVLAAFGLMACDRSTKSMLELFSVAVFTLALAAIWAYFIAWTLGFPPKMHWSILRLTADESVSHAHWSAVIVAAVLLAFWLYLCVRRMMRRPVRFWTGPWLSASGITVLWISAVCLFGPVIDGNRTYANIARDMSSALKTMHFVSGVDCVRAPSLSLSERAAIEWNSGVRITVSESETCRFTLGHTSADAVEDNKVRPSAGFVVLKSFRPRSDTRYVIGPSGPVIVEEVR